MNGLTSQRDGDVLVLRFSRAEKKNALTPDMLVALRDELTALSSSPDRPRALVLSGVGETFCAGFDLSLCRDDDTVISVLLRELSACILLLRNFPMPVVISAHGAAIAGGCALLGGADFVTTTTAAKLGYPVVRLGISPAVSVPFLRTTVGDAHARVRTLDPAMISGEEAVRIGLCTSAWPDAAACEHQALQLAKALASKPQHAVAATRAWLNEIDQSTNTTLANRALIASLALVNSSEQRERLAALWTAQPSRKE